jgi:putative ABC transport system ATP-binding protein
LDSKTGRDVIDLLVSLARKERCPILMVTHDTRIADMADRIIKMEDGRIISG